ncbi:TAXI family TRAP transporter solute-binding subunit [Candidatus Parabeggiatoa sp. HSG14]|uniref:TAXI family TRAP transporter solute-binding subunit n=1 Tax=Candidatus Parabeggiatoa sp. HSG14 TaxID=3055593 RepID=UPI0025A859FE|nr:TAXI family TRAP transporter solute-binding subunit [Thiotrichales bacterium HSG14]
MAVTFCFVSKLYFYQPTGTYYNYAGGVIKAAKETLDIELENVSTVGSLANAKAIVSGECDMGIVQADLYIQSSADFQTTPESKLFAANKGSVAALYPELVHILVNKDSGISSIADLAGKKVNMGENDSGTFLTANKILNVYNQLASTPEYFYEAPAESVTKVVDGTFDATFYVAGTPISALTNLPNDANVTLIPATIPGFNIDYMVSYIPATTYSWLYSDITNNIAVWALLTIGQSIDRTKLGPFLDTLYANKDAYADQYHAKWALLDKASGIANIKATPMNGWNNEVAHYFAEVPPPVVEPQLYFCSASPQGTYTKVVKDLIPVVESTLGISLTEKHTVGSLENMTKSYNGECAMYLVQSDVGGYLRSIEQNHNNITEMLIYHYEDAIMSLYSKDVHLVVNTGSGIESFLDLAGKKINLGEKLSGTIASAITMLLANGLLLKDIVPSYDSPVAALPKVISGEYDAMFVSSKAPVSYLVDADCPTETNVPGCIVGDPTTLPIKLLPIQTSSFIPKTTLSANHYPWQEVDILNSPQTITSVAFSANLFFDSNRVADFINAVYQLKVGDNTLSPTWDETTLEHDIISFKRRPIHLTWPAAQYFADKME